MARLRATGQTGNCGNALALNALSVLDPHLDVDDPYEPLDTCDDDHFDDDELDHDFDELEMP